MDDTGRCHELAEGCTEKSRVVDVGGPLALQVTRAIRWPLAIGTLDGDAVVVQSIPNYEVDEWIGAVRAALHSDGVQQGLAKLGVEAAGESQADFARVMRADLERWRPIVAASGFAAEE